MLLIVRVGWWVGLFVDLCLSSRLQVSKRQKETLCSLISNLQFQNHAHRHQRWDYWQQIWYYTLKYHQRKLLKEAMEVRDMSSLTPHISLKRNCMRSTIIQQMAALEYGLK